MAIHYHGLPITPASAAAKVLSGRHAFVSFATPDQLEIAMEVCQSFAIDNGAFSAWTAGAPITDWTPYYAWASECLKHPAADFAVIPDVIDGTEDENDFLCRTWPLGDKGVPVYHLHESLARLDRLSREWPRIALGSSGIYADPGSEAWWTRMEKVMDTVCDGDVPRTKLHGLRMLDPSLRRIPFSSMDSTSVGRNIGIDAAWGGRNAPASKEWRALVLAERFESIHCASSWQGSKQEEFRLGL
jgi:hypothetical protein